MKDILTSLRAIIGFLIGMSISAWFLDNRSLALFATVALVISFLALGVIELIKYQKER